MSTEGLKRIIGRLSEFSLKGTEVTGGSARALLFMFALIPFLGQTGVNHFAVGQYELGFLKAGSAAFSYLLTVLMIPYLPFIFQYNGWLLKFATVSGGPWFLYDIFQAMDTKHFEANGFQSPITIRNDVIPGGESTKWSTSPGPSFLFSMALVTTIGASLGVSGQFLTGFFPESDLVKKVGDGISIGGASIAGFGALTLFGSFLAGGTTMGAPAGAAALLAGGGGLGKPLPPLSQIIDKIQAGGAKETSENNIVLYVIGFIAFAGIALGALRSKQ
jgi:hypothetical protein